MVGMQAKGVAQFPDRLRFEGGGAVVRDGPEHVQAKAVCHFGLGAKARVAVVGCEGESQTHPDAQKCTHE